MKNTKPKPAKPVKPVSLTEAIEAFRASFPKHKEGANTYLDSFIQTIKNIEWSRPFTLNDVIFLSKASDIPLNILCAYFRGFTDRLCKLGVCSRIPPLVYDDESFYINYGV